MSVMITVEFKIKPEKVDEALEEMREGLPATRNFQGCQRIDSYFDKKNSSLFLVEFWDSLEDQRKYLKWRLADSGESVNNSIEANLFEPPIFKIYEAIPDL
jgi:quinol monooxygenase YgiN